MTSVGDTTTASAGLTAQFQTAATKTALDVQKQEGENALSLIQSAVEGGNQTSSGSATPFTGTNIDLVV